MNLNRAVFEDFVDTAEDPVDLILNKIQGVGHGGGIQVTAGSVDFANLERFLRQLANDGSTDSVALTAENLFDGVTMASPQKTLRRAAILFAGRLPTQEEVDAVRTGFVPTLRNTIRGLMEGQGFHDFLIDASNDRLLTDRQLDQETIRLDSSEFVALNQKAAEMRRASLGRGFEQLWRDPDYWTWEEGLQIGLARAPLELIAHVVENDLPYQEILTADYIMANPMAAEAYGASTRFDNVNDPFEFKPSAIDSYYRNDDSKVIERDETVDLDVVTNAGNLSTDYPHAGILNTTAFLRRYPSTATNRNRARSRWTYYYFLGLDVEKSASRTTDAAALADTNNPTMNNAACTVCHVVLDPVAGAFQNYGDEGLFRHEDGGLDSLPNLYKYPQEGSSLYVQGDTWYRNMRNPGFGDLVAPDASSSVSWLTQQIVADNRFSESAVRFWWPAIMGTEILNVPEDSGDPDFQGRLAAATAQDAEVKRLALLFRFGIAGGEPYNARDLLTEIALTPWFRAESVAVEDPVREAALREAGVARLLTPEELNRKTDAVSGFVWGRRFRQTMNPERGDLQSHLDGGSGYELLFGGIDSDGIITRGTDMTPVMAAVAQSHAAEVSCPIVRREFFFWEEDDRLLFDGVTRYDTPVSEVYSEFDVAADSWETRETFSVDVPMTAGSKTIMLGFANDYEEEADRNLNVDRLEVLDSAGDMVTSFEPEYLGNSRCGESQGFFNSYITIHGSGCFLDIPVEVFEDDTYQIDVVAHQDRAGGENARMTVAVESDDGVSAGATAIRNKLVDLHAKLYGLDVLPDSRDVDEAFNLFFEVWARKRRTEGTQFDNAIFECHDSDHTYYDEFSDVELKYSEWGGSYLDRDEVNQLYEDVEMSDFVQAVGGWDPTSFCDPKTNTAGERKINNWADNDEVREAGNIRYAPFANNQSFFDKYYSRMLVINGVDAQTNSHDAGVVHNWSGRISEGYPTTTALLAAHNGTGLAMPYLSFGGFSNTAGVAVYTRLDNPDEILNIARPHLEAGNPYNRPFFSPLDWETLTRHRDARLMRLAAAPNLMPREERNRLLYAASLQPEATEGLRAFADLVPNEDEFAEDDEGFDFRSNLKRQAQLAVLSFKAGVAVSADMYLGGFDTHDDHDNLQGWLLGALTDGVDYLWDYAEQQGLADRLVVVMGSDFARTNHYNSDNGKDHWPYGSFIIMEKNQSWTNRVIGETDDLHFAKKINATTLQSDDSGTLIYPRHIHKALRSYLGIENSPATQLFPFGGTESLALFS